MNIYSLSFKNIFENKWRTLTLGSFIFVVSFLLVFFLSFTSTIKSNMEEAISYVLTGDLQIREASTKEEDMFTMKGDWGDLAYLKREQTDKVEQALRGDEQIVESTRLVRHAALLSKDELMEPSLIVGMEPKTSAYKKYVSLLEGRYLSNDRKGEVVLPKQQATKLGVKVGDKINAIAQTKDGQPVQVPLEVVGIGEIELFATFAFAPTYVDLATAQELIGFQAGEATDLVVYLKDRQNAEQELTALTDKLAASGLSASDVKLSTWKDMGGFVLSTVNIEIMMFYACIAILLVIIAILITNIVLMMGLERRQEVGTLRAIGFNRSRIVQIFLGEILLITAIFFAIGAACGLLVNYIFSQVGLPIFSPLSNITGKMLYLNFDVAQVVPALLVVFGIALLSALYPSLKSASLSPVEALKEVS